MKPALQLRLSQSLALTPQLQQAIRLLQLSRAELELELNLALESNPLLDHDEASPGDDADDHEAAEAAREEPAPHEDTDQPLDFALAASAYRDRPGGGDDSSEPQDAIEEGLHGHLLWQLNLTPMSDRDRAIALVLIDAIDTDGYLGEGRETLLAALDTLPGISAAEIDSVRHRIQRFDPLGVGSRDLRECLLVQLEAVAAGTPGLALARVIADGHLESLARLDRGRLCQLLEVTPGEFDTALALIRSLAPRPGSGYDATPPEYIQPDAYAYKSGGRWQVTLAPDCQPRLGINQHYASLLARAQGEDASYLRGQLQEARWLIKSLETRAETMLKVATAIVRAQEAFLEFGAEAMRPLVLREVAEEIAMHESTVSRVTTRKFLHTPRGTFEFKYFFSSGVGTVDGGSASATAIQAMIRKLIADEEPGRPLSDQQLAAELNQRGINVARRTVAKYREAISIPSSNERSRLG